MRRLKRITRRTQDCNKIFNWFCPCKTCGEIRVGLIEYLF